MCWHHCGVLARDSSVLKVFLEMENFIIVFDMPAVCFIDIGILLIPKQPAFGKASLQLVAGTASSMVWKFPSKWGFLWSSVDQQFGGQIVFVWCNGLSCEAFFFVWEDSQFHFVMQATVLLFLWLLLDKWFSLSSCHCCPFPVLIVFPAHFFPCGASCHGSGGTDGFVRNGCKDMLVLTDLPVLWPGHSAFQEEEHKFHCGVTWRSVFLFAVLGGMPLLQGQQKGVGPDSWGQNTNSFCPKILLWQKIWLCTCWSSSILHCNCGMCAPLRAQQIQFVGCRWWMFKLSLWFGCLCGLTILKRNCFVHANRWVVQSQMALIQVGVVCVPVFALIFAAGNCDVNFSCDGASLDHWAPHNEQQHDSLPAITGMTIIVLSCPSSHCFCLWTHFKFLMVGNCIWVLAWHANIWWSCWTAKNDWLVVNCWKCFLIKKQFVFVGPHSASGWTSARQTLHLSKSSASLCVGVCLLSSVLGVVCFACMWKTGRVSTSTVDFIVRVDKKLWVGSGLFKNWNSLFSTQGAVFGSEPFDHTDWVVLPDDAAGCFSTFVDWGWICVMELGCKVFALWIRFLAKFDKLLGFIEVMVTQFIETDKCKEWAWLDSLTPSNVQGAVMDALWNSHWQMLVFVISCFRCPTG